MAIAKVKLTVVRRDCPDIEVQLGFFPTKEAALPEFKEVIARDDTLRAIIDTVAGERAEDNFACYDAGALPFEGPE
jgi:hypothetical protein